MSLDFNTRVEFFIGLTDQAGLTYDPGHTLTNTIAPLLGDEGIDGFTAVVGYGYWKGRPEQALVVTYFSLDEGPSNPARIARRIAAILNQEAVLVNLTRACGNLVGQEQPIKKCHLAT